MIPFAKREFEHGAFSTEVNLWRGGKERILLIHGIACTKEIFFLYPIIFPFHTFISYDQRGFGEGIAKDGDYRFERYVEDAEAIVSEYNPDLIVGHSFGGAVAQVLSAKTGIPAVALQTTTEPPKDITPKEYTFAVKRSIREAILDEISKYIFIPIAIPFVVHLAQYNPVMPAMKHLSELLDFGDLCPIDSKSKIVKVMAGSRDLISKKEWVKKVAECSGAPFYVYDVNHVGILYPDFVYHSLRHFSSTTGARA